MAQPTTTVLLGFESGLGADVAATPTKLKAAGTTFELEKMFEVTRGTARPGVAAAAPRKVTWHMARAAGPASESPWDTVREVAKQAAAQAARLAYAEPDLVQDWRPRTPKHLAL